MNHSPALRLLLATCIGAALPGCIFGGKKSPPPAAAPAPSSGAPSLPVVAAPEVQRTSNTAPENNLPASIPPVKGKSLEAFSLRYIDLRIGTGTEARPRACYFVHFTGWLTNGEKFESSIEPLPSGAMKPPVGFPQGAKRVIPGWDVGFEGMRVGGQRRLFVPYQLAYGVPGNPPEIPMRAALIFDVELMAVVDPIQRAPARGQAAPPPQCPTWDVARRSH